MADLRHNNAVALAIGKKVRSLRLEKARSAHTIAEALGINVTTFEAAERGEQDLTADQIVALSDVLEVQPSWFFEDLIEGHSTTDGSAGIDTTSRR